MNRRNRTPYFPPEPGSPIPLASECRRQVRYEECDPLGVVWHGRYASYFEDGRTAFGEKYGLSYMNMFDSSFLAPIVRMYVEYFQPLRFPEEMLIRTELCWSEVALLNFQYQISGIDGKIRATGYTVQSLTERDLQPLLVRPPLLEDFWQRWSRNELK